MTLIEVGKLLALFGDWYVEEGTAEGFIGTIKDLIETVPTIEQPHWIPCSEKLPEEDGVYLVTRLKEIYVDIARYWNGEWSSEWPVIAWMPLPVPYKEGEE